MNPAIMGHDGAGADNPEDAPHEDVDPDLREQLLDEFREQAALERFQAERPDFWLQVQRIGKLMDFQGELEDQSYPEGTCFLYTNTPVFNAFSVRRVLEIDLDTCLVTLEIHQDNDLDEGIILLPLETIAWFGFPAHATPVHFKFQGFTGLAGLAKND